MLLLVVVGWEHEFLLSTLQTYRIRLRYVWHFVLNVEVHGGAS